MTEPTPKNTPSSAPENLPPKVEVSPEKTIDNPIDQKLKEQKEKTEKVAEVKDDTKREKAETTDATKEGLSGILKNIVAGKDKPAEKNDAPAAVPEKKWYKYSTWSPEEQEKAANIATIGAIGIGVVGGLLLMRSMWNRAKKVGSAVKEKTSSAWNILKFGLIAGVLTAGGYFGLKWMKQARENLQKIEQAKKELETLKNTLTSMPAELRAQAEVRVRVLEETIRNTQKPQTNPDAKPGESDAPKEDATKPTLTPEQQELVKAAKRQMVAQAVIHLYETPEWKVGAETKATQVTDAIRVNQDLTMDDVLKSATNVNNTVSVHIAPPFIVDGNDKESRTQAAELLITFCADQQDEVVKSIMKKKNVSQEDATKEMLSMKLPAFVEEVTSYYTVLPELITSMAQANGDPVKAFDNLKKEFLQDNAAIREAVNNHVAELGLTDEELAQFSTAELLKIIAAEMSTGGSVTIRLQEMDPNSKKVEEKVLHSILTHIASGQDDTAKYMIPCFQEIFPEKEEGMDNEEYIKRYLLERMPASQAVRFYLYKEMIKSGNPTGLVMMQVEVLKLIADSDMSFLNYQKNKAMVRIMEGVAGKGATDLANEWKKHGIDIPPEVFEHAQKGLGLICKIGVGGALLVVREKGATLQALASEYTVAATGLFAYAGARKGTSLLMHNTINTAERAIYEYGLKGSTAADLFEPNLAGKIMRNIDVWGVGRGETLQKWIAAKKVLKEVEALKASGAIPQNVKPPAAAEFVLKETQWKAVLAKYGKNVAVEDVDALLKLAAEEGAIALDKDTLALISQSPGAKKIIAGAVDSVDITEVTRALNAAKSARNLRIGLNSLGAAGDAFAIYMAYADYTANGERIETAKLTKNAALAELYENANYVYAAEGTQGAVGLAVGGVVIVKAVAGGQSVLTALGTTGGLIMLPVAVAAISGRYVYDKAEKVTETWLRESEDWQRALTPGELLEKMKEVGPGNRPYWQGWGKGTITEQALRLRYSSPEEYRQWEEEGDRNIENANEKTRYELTKAYIVTSSLLPKETGETDTQYKSRFDQYVLDRMEYETRTSEATFSYSKAGYETGRMYADLMAKSRSLKQKSQSEVIDWQDADGQTHSFNLADFAELPWSNGSPNKQLILRNYMFDQKLQTITQINIMQKLPVGMNEMQKEKVVKQQLILGNIDNLWKLDGRIATANFSGVLGGEDQAEALARYTAHTMLREALTKQTQNLLEQAKKPEGISPEDYNNALNAIAASIGEKDPLEYQRIGVDKHYTKQGFITDREKTRQLLTPLSLLNETETDTVKPVEDTTKKEALKAKTSAELAVLCEKEGKKFMGASKIAASNGKIYWMHDGLVFNKHLYARFNNGAWEVAIGGGGNGPWNSPDGYIATATRFGFSADVAGKYNKIIKGLSDINHTYHK